MAVDHPEADISFSFAGKSIQPGQIDGIEGNDKGSPLPDSDTKSMDISPAVVEGVTVSSLEFNQEINAFVSDINVAEPNKVKKKLDYNQIFMDTNVQVFKLNPMEKIMDSSMRKEGHLS